MDIKDENRKKSNLLLVLAIIAASLLVIWVITIFDRMDNPGNTQKINNKTIKQTITNNQGYNFFNLLQIEKNYT